MRLRRSLPATTVGLLVLALAGAKPSSGQLIYRLGSTQQLIPTDGAPDYGQQLLCTPGGPFLAVWISQDSPTTVQIVAQSFAANGSPLTAEIPVTPPDGGFEEPGSVARDAAGNFVVVWWHPVAEGASNAGVRARLFSSGGVGGSEFAANSYTVGSQRRPSVARRQDGSFVVVWSGEGPGAVIGIWKREFNAAGGAVGVETLVEAGANDWPLVKMHPTNDTFVIAWIRDDGDLDVRARRYSAAGAPLAAAFDVNSSTTGDQALHDMAVDADGDFVILFAGEGQGDSTGILGQLFDAGGVAVSPEFWVNGAVTGTAYAANVAFLPSGEFLVAWSNLLTFAGRGFAARYSATGFRVGGTDFPITLGFDPDRNQDVSSLCADGDFTFRVAIAERDGSDEEFLSQRLSSGLFADGFESNNLNAWSSSTP